MMLGIIKHNFRHLTIPTFVLLYKTMVRSHLNYCFSAWAPCKKGDIEALGKVQKRATKIPLSLRHIGYPDRLKVCKLTTLHYRQIRGDMIEVYKIVSGKYYSAITPTLIISDTHKTRGNDYDSRSLVLNMICVSFTLLAGLLTNGIACPIGS